MNIGYVNPICYILTEFQRNSHHSNIITAFYYFSQHRDSETWLKTKRSNVINRAKTGFETKYIQCGDTYIYQLTDIYQLNLQGKTTKRNKFFENYEINYVYLIHSM